MADDLAAKKEAWVDAWVEADLAAEAEGDPEWYWSGDPAVIAAAEWDRLRQWC